MNQEYLYTHFTYADGKLFWKTKRQNIEIGDIAGSYNKANGYCNVKINSKSYKVHRLIFLFHNGYLPERIDHIDQNKANNNIDNLRVATHAENMKNRKSVKNSSSQYLGVYFHKRMKKWYACIKVDFKNKHLGVFKTEKDAALKYNNAAVKYHGEFASLNIISII